MKKLNVKINLNRYMGSHDGFDLDITDVMSGCLILRADIKCKDIANLISGRLTEATAELIESENYGKNKEVKTIYLSIDGYGEHHLKAVFDEADRLYPKWQVSREVTYNAHRMSDGKYEVHLYRYV